MQPFLQWKNKEYYIFWGCVCSLRYPESAAKALYFHLWPHRLCYIFPHYLIKGTIFAKQLLKIRRVFWLSVQRLSATFLILRINERDVVENVYWSSCKVLFILVRC